jgi:DNA-binding transcriptional regulator YhcF (GntR family)
MKVSPAVPMWRQVADHLRAQILDGTFPAGQVLPSEETLAREFGVSRPVIRDGIKTLVSEGFVEIRRPHGNLVRDPYAAPTRTEHATTGAGDWTDAEDPTFYRTNATADQAELLAIPPGEPLLTREAIQQAAGIRRYHRLHMPFSVAEHTPWADDPTCRPHPTSTNTSPPTATPWPGSSTYAPARPSATKARYSPYPQEPHSSSLSAPPPAPPTAGPSPSKKPANAPTRSNSPTTSARACFIS